MVNHVEADWTILSLWCESGSILGFFGSGPLVNWVIDIHNKPTFSRSLSQKKKKNLWQISIKEVNRKPQLFPTSRREDDWGIEVENLTRRGEDYWTALLLLGLILICKWLLNGAFWPYKFFVKKLPHHHCFGTALLLLSLILNCKCLLNGAFLPLKKFLKLHIIIVLVQYAYINWLLKLCLGDSSCLAKWSLVCILSYCIRHFEPHVGLVAYILVMEVDL